MRYAQLVMGPAGSGKSSYCTAMVKHAQVSKRNIQVVNLDPAADSFDYEPLADIRELIHLEDAMEDEELHFGPNGGLIYCMEYFIQNPEWLQEELGSSDAEIDDDYILFDCPGQIELYTHLNVMRQLLDTLHTWNFRVCGVFILDSQFMVDPAKFFSGTLAALSTMVNLEVPHLNVLSKIDLLDKKTRKTIERYLDPDTSLLLSEGLSHTNWNAKHQRLSETIGKLIDDYSLVRFVPLDPTDEESIENVLLTVDNAIQYGEDLDVNTKDYDEMDDTKTDDDDDNVT